MKQHDLYYFQAITMTSQAWLNFALRKQAVDLKQK